MLRILRCVLQRQSLKVSCCTVTPNFRPAASLGCDPLNVDFHSFRYVTAAYNVSSQHSGHPIEGEDRRRSCLLGQQQNTEQGSAPFSSSAQVTDIHHLTSTIDRAGDQLTHALGQHQLHSRRNARSYSTADVIKKLRIPSKQVPNPDEAGRLAHMHEWQVLVVHPDCKVEESIETAEALGLAPRDTSLFAPQPVGVSGQRATIVPRETAVLVRTEIARAIIHQDKTVLFPCRKDRDTLRLTQSIINNVSEAGPLPFELRVLEALLDETARQFERRQRRLELLAMSIEEDIQKTLKQNGADLQRLLPIQRALTELVHDVKEAEEAIAGVLDDDQALAAICLSEKDAHQAAREGRQAPSMRLAAALLGSYERQIQSVEGALREMSENLEVFREVWSMHLSATRNRIIRINLIVTVASFALTACIVPASFFGMNLPSGLEEHDTMFWSVVGLSAVASASLFAGIYAYWKYYPHTRHQRRVNDLKALRDLLLYHVDDLEDILVALQERPEMTAGMAGTRTMMGRDEFTKLVQSSIQDCQVRKDEIDLLYNLLDINRDGLLELKEVVKSQERLGGKPFDDTLMKAAARAA